MRLDKEDILAVIDYCESARHPYNKAADAWESMYWSQRPEDLRTSTEARHADGEEKVVIPTPRNVVNLGMRMIASEPRIEALATKATEKQEDKADKRAGWLTAYHQQRNKEQRENLIDSLKWQAMVLARPTLQCLWVKDIIPEMMRDTRLPILTRWLDPRQVGFVNGPFGPTVAYHKYDELMASAVQRYPDIKKMAKYKNRRKGLRDHDLTVEISDFWYKDDKGTVWHCVLAEDEYVKNPKKTLYPDLPIMQVYAEGAPVDDEVGRSVSMLDAVKDIWDFQNDTYSRLATALLYFSTPIITVEDEFGSGFENNIDMRPGRTYYLKKGQKMNVVRVDLNMMPIQFLLTQIDMYIQQATFPGVSFGEQPGQVQAGYGINILQNQARGRMTQIRQQLETLLEQLNQFILRLIEVFADESEGVRVWGMSDREGKPYSLTIKKSDINGYYENEVDLAPSEVDGDTARIQQGILMVEKNIISVQTFLEKILNAPIPRDEVLRVQVEMAMKSPDLQQKVMLRAIQQKFPDKWEDLIWGTPLQQLADQEKQRAEQQRMEAEARRLEEEAGPGGLPALLTPGGMPPGGPGPLPPMPMGPMPPEQGAMPMPPTPPLPPPGPPMDPTMMPPGMMGAMPPGMMPPNPNAAPGPMGMPPGMPPGNSMQPPGLAGIPPADAGQLTPEQFSVTPAMEQALPGIGNMLLGEPPMTDLDLLRKLASLGG